MPNDNLQPYERAFVLSVAMETSLTEQQQRSIIKRYANTVDRPYLEAPMLAILELFLLERKKAGLCK